MNILAYAKIEEAKERLWLFADMVVCRLCKKLALGVKVLDVVFTGAPNENIVQNYLNITLLTVF